MRELPIRAELGNAFNTNLTTDPLWPIRVRTDQGLWTQLGVAVAAGVGFGLLCVFAHLMRHSASHLAIFWPADGALMAFLLYYPMRRWWLILSFSWLADAGFSMLLPGPSSLSAYMASCHTVEVLIGAVLLQRALAREPDRDMASPAMMWSFFFFAILLAPAISSSMAAMYHVAVYGIPFKKMFANWFLPHALGMAMMGSLTFAAANARVEKIFKHGRILRALGTLLLPLLASVYVFRQTTHSLVFLLLPLLMLTVFEIGMSGAIIACFEILVVGALFTLYRLGPFWISPLANMQTAVFLLQVAILALLGSVVPFAATLERQHQLRHRLQLGMQRYQLLADNSRDMVVLVNLEGRNLYVSPAVLDVLGWTQEEWVQHTAMEMIHPEDRGPFQRLLKEIQHGADRRTFRYRTRHKNGKYIWMEANIRAVPQTLSGEPAAFVANLRDVSERMESEKKLAAAHEHVQQQAQRDSLTQLANRRCFDEALEREWRRGRRVGNPVTLLMVDIDHFKQINDSYGHRVGDQCLQALAAVLCRMARRPNDLVARYGGEEFAVLLPDVNLARAVVMAEALCLKVRQYMFEAGVGSPLSLTVSIGVAAQVPSKMTRGDGLVEAADRALYDAKRAGRNCIMPVSADDEFPVVFQQLLTM